MVTWRLSTTEVGNASEIWCKPELVTAHSSADQKLYTLAEFGSEWLLFPTTVEYLMIYFSQSFEEWSFGDDEIEKTQHEEKIRNYYDYPESFWVDSDFCT